MPLVRIFAIGYTVSMKHGLLLLFLALLWLGAPRVATACPSCRDALATSENKDGTPGLGFGAEGEAISASVIFMLAIPFLMASGFGLAFYRLSRPVTAPPSALPASTLVVGEALST